MTYVAALMRQTSITLGSASRLPGLRAATESRGGIDIAASRFAEPEAASPLVSLSDAALRTPIVASTSAPVAARSIETSVNLSVPPSPFVHRDSRSAFADRAERQASGDLDEPARRSQCGTAPLEGRSAANSPLPETVIEERVLGGDPQFWDARMVQARASLSDPPHIMLEDAPGRPAVVRIPSAADPAPSGSRPLPTLSDIRAWMARPLLDEARGEQAERGDGAAISTVIVAPAASNRDATASIGRHSENHTLEIGTIQITIEEPAPAAVLQRAGAPPREPPPAASARAGRHYLR
jgi:hypothetical protein